MPALRTRDTHPRSQNALELVLDPTSFSPSLSDGFIPFTPTSEFASSLDSKSPVEITLVSPTPRAATFPFNISTGFTFPTAHNLADSPFSSPSSSPFEGAAGLSLGGLDLGGNGGNDGGDGGNGPFLTMPKTESEASSSPVATSPSTVTGMPMPLPLSAFTRTLSPFPATVLPSAVPALAPAAQIVPPPTRRKSSSTAPTGERRPKKGDDDYVKRPENAFILFRRQACAERDAASAPASLADGPTSSPTSLPAGKKARQADLSKAISAQWRALPAEERAKWEALAKEKKREHAERYPGYVYRPQRKGSMAKEETVFITGDSKGKRRKGSAPTLPTPVPVLEQPVPHAGAAPVEFVLPAPRPRSQSHNPTTTSRTPVPAYQAIQIPNVYASASSSSNAAASSSLFIPSASPNEMSLLPMIAQSAQQRMDGGFDYLPSFGSAAEFEASLQSSDFLRAMFPPNHVAHGLPPLTLSTSSSSDSPASSTPGSPYTPAASVVSPYTTPTPGALLDAAYPQHHQQQCTPTNEEPNALSQPFGFGAPTDPWAAYSFGAGVGGDAAFGGGMDFDFDLASIPAVGGGWGVGVAADGAVEGGQPLALGMDVDGTGSGKAGSGLFGMDFGGFESEETWMGMSMGEHGQTEEGL
ncbi:HMG box domain-containing protein [Mycena chlorophos]|uniref:HMG box domain-containing protein n=1 Tax=Mycena chlorophos TaxID=658473 RepID=A0A8H6TJL0_MYCCL|nr:HMG box domain-containing protein [Mycena chlorophos]